MSEFRLDRTKFSAGTKKEQRQRDQLYWSQQSIDDRFQSSWYLTLMSYGLDPYNPPRLDKTAFSMRKHDNGECSKS